MELNTGNCLSCPFCGQILVWSTDSKSDFIGHAASCVNCPAKIIKIRTKEDLENWNMRVPLVSDDHNLKQYVKKVVKEELEK